MACDINAVVVRELLDYDPGTGVLRWKSIRARSGDVAGTTTSEGYRRISIHGRTYLAHRIIWLHVYGEWPPHTIDHINGARSDNRLENLRSIPHALNAQNTHKAKSNSVSGIAGVEIREGRFYARIWIKGRGKRLGAFATESEAHSAYIKAKTKHHEGFVA